MKQKISISLTPRQIELLEAEADKKGIAISDLMRHILDERNAKADEPWFKGLAERRRQLDAIANADDIRRMPKRSRSYVLMQRPATCLCGQHSRAAVSAKRNGILLAFASSHQAASGSA